MTDQTPPPPPFDPTAPPPPPTYAPPAPPPPPAYGAPANPYGGPPVGYAQPGYGPIGQVRSTGLGIFLYIITLGIYGWYWYFQTSEEMKRHSGQGLGGALSLVLAIFIGVANPFITSSEVGGLYERQGRPKPVSGTTGLWVIPGFLLLGIGPIVWFVKTNGALNEYWKSMGAPA
jgi:hypothetical protein